MKIGYTRVSTGVQDRATQHRELAALGVDEGRIYVDLGLSSTHERPALAAALAACGPGDELVAVSLARFSRSSSDAHNIADQLAQAGVRLNLGGSVYDPMDRAGREVFGFLAMVAESDGDRARDRAVEAMAVASQRGRLKGKPPKLTAKKRAELVKLRNEGDMSKSELAEYFKVDRSTIYRTLEREDARAAPAPTSE